MSDDWKLEDQLTDKEIDEIVEHELTTAKELVYQKEQEAEIYITYLRKEADRLEHQMGLLKQRLQQKVDADFMAKINANNKSKTIKANRNRMRKLRAVSGGRQHLIKH